MNAFEDGVLAGGGEAVYDCQQLALFFLIEHFVHFLLEYGCFVLDSINPVFRAFEKSLGNEEDVFSLGVGGPTGKRQDVVELGHPWWKTIVIIRICPRVKR